MNNALLFLILLASGMARAGEMLTFSNHGKAVANIPPADVKKIGARGSVNVREPHEERAIEFEAVPLVDVLDRAYGQTWRKAGTVLFVCADGYKDPIEVD